MAPKVRRSPTESASAHAVGTRKVGNDGREYVVVETAAGVRRWAPATKMPATRTPAARTPAKAGAGADIFWRTTRPLSTAHAGYVDGTDETIPVPAAVWSAKLPVRRGDRVTLVYFDSEPAVTAPVRGNTLKDVLLSIEAAMAQPIGPEQFAAAYKAIGAFLPLKAQTGMFWQKPAVVRLVEKLVAGTLTPHELVNDNYDFFEGNLTRGPGGVWQYAVGS